MEVPQVIRIKRRIDEDPVQALVVESERRKKLKTQPGIVFRFRRTEGRHRSLSKATGRSENEGRCGIPVVRATGPLVFGPAKEKQSLSPATSSNASPPGTSTPTKRKSPIETISQSAPGVVGASIVSSEAIPYIDHTPPTPLPKDNQTDLNRLPSPNVKLLQVPQPRKFHLAHRQLRLSKSIPVSPTRRGQPVQKKSAIFMGEENFVGRAVPSHRASKRRREKKEELRFVRSKENLRGELGSRSSSVGSISSIVSLQHELSGPGTPRDTSMSTAVNSATAITVRKRPRVHPKEKKERENLRRGKQAALVDTTVLGSLGKDKSVAAKSKLQQQKVNDIDDEMADALQKMVLDYLCTQEGITNLPPTESILPAKKTDRRDLRVCDKMKQKTPNTVQIDKHIVKMERDTTDEEAEEEGWVYDVYVRETVSESKENSLNHNITGNDGAVTVGLDYGVLVISNSDDEEWFYEGGWDDGDDTGDVGMSDDEDSNAEDYFTNDYPDEDEGSDYFLYGQNRDFDEDNDDYDYDEFERVINAGYSGTSSFSELGDDRNSGGDDDEMGLLRKLNNKRILGQGSRGRLGRTMPDEEEYDLAEYDTETDDEERVDSAMRRSLERGIWDLDSISAKTESKRDEAGLQQLTHNDDEMAVSYH